MPIIKSAIKKLRKDRKLERINDLKRAALKRAIKKAEKGKKEADVRTAISLIDKAVKTHLLQTNKASRLKSKLAKLALQTSIASHGKTAGVKSSKSKIINRNESKVRELPINESKKKVGITIKKTANKT